MWLTALVVVMAVVACKSGGEESAHPTGSGSAPTTTTDAAIDPVDTAAATEGRKLFHCAAASGEVELIIAANVKLGLGTPNGAPTDKLKTYAAAQPAWTKQNMRFATEHADPTKAAACARERLK